MHEQDVAILHTLVSVAWADGEFAERERQLLDALLESFGATEGEVKLLHEYAATPKTLADVPLTELSHGDRRAALQHAVVLSWVDGSQSKEEVDLLEQLRAKMNIPPEEAKPLMDAANARAKELLHLLETETDS